MVYKALVSFAGLITMTVGEERELSDENVADLLRAGYIEPVTAETKPKTTRKRK